MNEPIWLLQEAVVAVHGMLVAQHGGLAGIHDHGLLESALACPVNRYAYDGEAALFDLAAGYAWGLARTHPFADGNKRIAITVVAMFLRENGYRFAPEPLDALRIFIGLAAGEIKEDALARWIEASTGAP